MWEMGVQASPVNFLVILVTLRGSQVDLEHKSVLVFLGRCFSPSVTIGDHFKSTC